MVKKIQTPLFGKEQQLDESDKNDVRKKSNGALEVVRYKSTLRNGIELGDAVSCLQKAIRRGEPELDTALTVGCLILEKYPFYLFRRLSVIAAEDCLDPMASVVTNAIYNSWLMNRQRQSAFMGKVMVSKLICFLVRQPKNREADSACIYIGARLENNEPFELPDYTFDGHTRKGKQLGRGVKYFHEESAKLVNEQGKDMYKVKMVNYLKKLGKYV